jgi:hypothetical protein
VKSPRRKPAAEPDRIRNLSDRETRAQNQDAPDHRLFFLVLLRTLLGIALAHPTLTRDAKDHLTGLIRALIDHLEQQRRPAPSAGSAHDSQHSATAAIRARTACNPARNQGPTGGRRRRPRAEPAPPPSPGALPCPSANRVRGPPHIQPPVRA